ncbi:MAG: T9SS type A sorting domain-containing protein, partial [Candidatus Latescibacterota bacterium]
PNPFNPSTTIRFSVPDVHQGAHVELAIYDLLGQKVRTLVASPVETSGMEVAWDGRDDLVREVSSGVYLYRLTTEGGKWTDTRKMVLIR